ncbi:MAG: hypothetical protein SFW67_03170 [Myxococcaceae bacterium]|nr:hypothetical protein [Myxococcaceae bacterium]
MRVLIVVSLSVVGCSRVASEPVVVSAPVAAPTVSCTTVEGARLGALPLTVDVGGAEVAFAEWNVPDETSTDVVGFAAHLPGGVSVTVKAGDEEFHTTAPRWTHPRGVSGPRVHPVERITFCRLATPAVVAVR